MRLRYTGTSPTTFLNWGELTPGQEFEADGEWAERFLNHGLIEPVDPASKAARKTGGDGKAKTDTGGGAKPDADTNQ